VQHGSRVAWGVLAVALRVDVRADHPPSLADVQLIGQVLRLLELVAAPTPLARFLSEVFWDFRIVLQEEQQSGLIAKMLIENCLPRGLITAGPS
jgi:hypothetical protein